MSREVQMSAVNKVIYEKKSNTRLPQGDRVTYVATTYSSSNYEFFDFFIAA